MSRAKLVISEGSRLNFGPIFRTKLTMHFTGENYIRLASGLLGDGVCRIVPAQSRLSLALLPSLIT
jgi:hypothetical protein